MIIYYPMMIGRKFIQVAIVCFGIISSIHSAAQTNIPNKYPQGYFRNPLNIPMSLVANFGELRPGHWHMGLDLRTERRENLPVYAAADGYIAHVGVRPLSFGKFIIINHPNGLSTLYGHLNEFYPELENYVQQKQKEKESWAIDLDFTEKDFRVKKGDYIAKSGNTGGSQGPHLHFEIRDIKTSKCLNTLLFGFNVKDDVPPTISRLAVYDRNIGTYLQTPQIFSLSKTANGYVTKPAKILTGNRKISFAITATDRVSGSNGANGIFGATLYYDSSPQIGFMIDSIDYDESDYVNAQIDSRYRKAGGPYVQHLSKLPGFRGNFIYNEMNGDGIIELNDTLVHDIKINVIDANENLSTLSFQVQYSEALTKNTPQQTEKLLAPNQVNIIDEKEFAVYMPEDCLYDSVPLSYSQQNIFPANSVTARHVFGNPVYPLHSDFSVRLKTTQPVAENLKNKLVIVKEWKGTRAIRKGKWENSWVTAAFDNLGIFQAFIDIEAPAVRAPREGKDTLDLSPLNKIVFTPSDNSAVRSFKAELDGQWLKFSNDKGRNYIYIFDEQCPYGVHELKVRVEDIVGNVIEKTWWFKRHAYTPPKKIYKKKPPIRKKGTVKKK